MFIMQISVRNSLLLSLTLKPKHTAPPSHKRNQLLKTLEHKEVAEKPILIVGTKMDMDGALNEDSLFNVYDLDTILSENR